MLSKPQAFAIHIPEGALDDLRLRLRIARVPDQQLREGWSQGVEPATMERLVAYWRDEFDWRAQESVLNGLATYTAEIDGFRIHFVHERGRGPNPIPLVLTHGWPSSFTEFLKVIPHLADPVARGGDAADAFDVVIPSLPGFGFSSRPSRPGRVPVADLWVRLMSDVLGYERFGAQAGDIGSAVTTDLARFHPEHLLGIHLTGDLAWPEPMPSRDQLTRAERDFVDRVEASEPEDGGYREIQATRPQTLGYALNDSPIGLAAWILDKFEAWNDVDRHVLESFTLDELLTNITIYWVTETITSSIRYYYEARYSTRPGRDIRVRVPTGVAMFPKDFAFPREWAERCYNVVHWSEIPAGGHFAALEQPELLARDIAAFFRPFR